MFIASNIIQLQRSKQQKHYKHNTGNEKRIDELILSCLPSLNVKTLVLEGVWANILIYI